MKIKKTISKNKEVYKILQKKRSESNFAEYQAFTKRQKKKKNMVAIAAKDEGEKKIENFGKNRITSSSS